MIDLKADFSGGLNLDDSYYTVPKNSYVDALNITRDAITGSNDRAITNIFGNRYVGIASHKEINEQTNSDILSIFADTGTISIGTRLLCILKTNPGNVNTIILDYTTTKTVTNTQFMTDAAASLVSCLNAVTGSIEVGGAIPAGTYNVIQNETSGIGYGAEFSITINSSNTITGIAITKSGINYKPGDTIRINGAQFGQTTSEDDVIINVSSVSIKAGIITYQAIGNELQIEYNTDATPPNIAYIFESYSLRIGHALEGYTCIGAYPNTVRNKIIYFLYQEDGYHMILDYDIDTEINIKILENLIDSDNIDILGFTNDKKITSVNVYNREEGDLLYFLDTLGRPTGLDIELFKNGEYIPVTRDIIDVCKRPPLSMPLCLYQNDTIVKSNNLRGKFFRFKYRYVYDDLSKSVCSPISTLPIPLNILDFGTGGYNNIITNNNAISIGFNSGEKDVKSIELLMSYVNKTNDWSDFAIIDTIGKELKYNVQTYNDTSLSPIKQYATITFYGTLIPNTLVELYVTTDINPITVAYIDNETTFQSLIQQLIINCVGLYNATGDNNSITISYDLPTEFDRVNIEHQQGVDNIQYNYYFYNDSTYPLIDIQESIQLYDYVPELANAQELANGNVLVYGGITEGYDKNYSPNIEVNVTTYPEGPGNAGLGTISIARYQESVGGRNQVTYRFWGTAPALTEIKIFAEKNGQTPLLTKYTVQDGDTINDIAYGLFQDTLNNGIAIRQRYYLPDGVSFTLQYYKTNPYYLGYETIEFPTSASTGLSNPFKTFLNNTTRNIGIAYFDKKGKTNGILWNERISMPKYDEDSSGKILLPQINLSIYNQPPIWAHSYQIYLTKENTQFLDWLCVQIIASNDNYLYFNITTLTVYQNTNPTTSSVVSWSFQEGDRIKILKRYNPSTIFNENYDSEIYGIITDPYINGTLTSGIYVKVPNSNPIRQTFTAPGIYSNTLIRLYRNNNQDPRNIYYEFGQQYPIFNPGTPLRIHSGSKTIQNIDSSLGPITPALTEIRNGDVYLRQRILSRAGLSNTLFGADSFFAFDRNVVDLYPSAVNDVMGRPNAIDNEAKRAYYSTLVRFGQAYQPNTNINGIPRFYSTNFDEYDYSFGDIMRFKTRDRFIRVFQKLKVGMVPLYQQMVKNQDSQTLVISDKLLNPIQYYQGDVGIGDNPESLASFNYADYFTSNIKGAICRVSQDGVVFLSIDHKVNSWANAQVGDLAKRFKIGVFDQRLSNYILYLGPSDNNSEVTIVFDQEYNSFESFLSLYPEMMCCLGTTFASFKNGNIYIHNNSPYNTFFDEPAADSTITPIFNEGAYQKKTFLALSEVASTVWDAPTIQTDLYSYGTTRQTTNLVNSDFQQLEGTYEASILRDYTSQGGIFGGDSMKGKYLLTRFRKTSASSLVILNIVSCKYIDSPLTNR